MNYLFPLQNIIPLVGILLVRSACFPSCTKTNGIQTAQRLTPKQSAAGVQLRLNMSMNNGDTAQLLVSFSALTLTRHT